MWTGTGPRYVDRNGTMIGGRRWEPIRLFLYIYMVVLSSNIQAFAMSRPNADHMDPTRDAEADSQTRRSFLVAAGGASMAALAGCADEDDLDEGDPADDGAGDDGGSEADDENVIEVSIAPTDSFDNIRTKGDGSEAITYQIYAGLMTYGLGEFEPVGELAEDYTISEDGTVYEFDLREGRTFHDGSEFTAHDIVYSWERLVGSPNTQEARHITTDIPVDHDVDAESPGDAAYPDDYVPGSLAVEAVDDHTLRMELRAPWHSVLEKLTIGEVEPIPEGLVDDAPGYDGEMGFEEFESSPPPGLGPFEFVEYQEGSHARLEAFDDYYGEGPHVDAIEMTVLADDDGRYQRALGGDVDIFEIPETQYDDSAVEIDTETQLGVRTGTYELENGETVNYGEWQDVYTAYIINNAERVPKHVRQAMAYTLNQHQIVDEAFNGLGVPSYMYTPPTVYPGGPEAYMEKAREEYPYGFDERLPGEARDLMESNGHDADDPFELTFTTFSDRQPNAYDRLANLMREQLGPVHIDVSIEQVPFNTIIDRAIGGELDSFSLGNSIDYPEAQDTLRYARGDPNDFSRWYGTESAERAADIWENEVLANPGPSEGAVEAREQAYIEMEEANWEEVPDIMLYHPVETEYWSEDLEYEPPSTAFHRQQYNHARFE